MSKLVIVESPNKIKSIEKYLGEGYNVLASVGHIVYLPSSGEHRFGVDMDTWTPQYKIDPNKAKVVKELKDAIKKVDEVLIATDPDREGEAIADNLVEFLKIENKYHRIRFNEITKEAILESLENQTKVDEDLVKSQIARRIIDRIIGYKLSGLMRKKISGSPMSPSAGRVQSIALKLVVEREKLIDAFVPTQYVTASAIINDEVVADFHSGNYEGNKPWIDPKEVENIRKDLKGALKVESVNVSKRNESRLTPLKQAALYKKADSSLGMSSRAVQRAAQNLYEGYGDGGLISYPRTDSTRLSSNFVAKAHAFISKTYGADLVAPEIKGTAGSQDAHEAIRPTDPTLTPARARALFNLGNSEFKVYELIYNHTLMSLMKVPVRETLRYDLSENGHKFKLSSSKVIYEGYLKIIGYSKNKELPVYREGEVIPVKDYVFEDHETKPPARYNDGSLIETLDNIGVGRPSTFSTTVNILKDRAYVDLEGRALKPTDFGKLVSQKLLTAFPDIIEETYTAKMERELDEIAEGKHNYRKLLNDFWQLFEEKMLTATQELSVTKLAAIPAGKDCPKCGSPLVVRTNKKDKTRFFACSSFPECKHTESDPTSKKIFRRWKKK